LLVASVFEVQDIAGLIQVSLLKHGKEFPVKLEHVTDVP
jgi:hypothetical protein